jgi:hypothetical protein
VLPAAAGNSLSEVKFLDEIIKILQLPNNNRLFTAILITRARLFYGCTASGFCANVTDQLVIFSTPYSHRSTHRVTGRRHAMTAKAGVEKYFEKYIDNLTCRRLAPEKSVSLYM